MRSFLNPLHLPHFTVDQRLDLEEPLTLSELQESIRALATGKSTGPDGLPTEFSKTYAHLFPSLLLKVYKEALTVSEPSLLQCKALLISLPKPGHDQALPGSYMPLAMLNMGYNVLAKAHDTRVAPLVP
ncbi:hypothetical protein NDU88_002933 [Pleurodeles waltl]|uniref:Reverse transcriptase n=1 Tax=Pleurodeles waltl TaxID=8319 RepID=A0AAV7T522_PLEWA|nr:hypothetical protein NDU88_002933 [Pleurodeles waltl]